MHIAVSTVNVKASSKKYFIIIICLCLEMQEGIEPTVSTIPLGCTNKIVSGDRPSTVSSDQTKHTISFSSECGWIPCEPLARDSTGCRDETHHSIPYSSIIQLPPSHPTHRFFHYKRYISLLRQHDVLERHIFPHPVWVACSHSLIPETNLLAVTSAVYVWTLRLTHAP